MRMQELKEFIARIDRYIEATEAAESTVSLRLFDDGKRIAALRSGAGITLAGFEKAKARLGQLELAAMRKNKATRTPKKNEAA